MKSDISVFFENLSRIIQFSLKSDKNNRYFTWKQHTFLITSRWILLRMRNVSDKNYRENQNTHFVFSNFFFENRAVYEIMWKKVLEQDRPQMTIWRMRIACRVTKAKHTLTISNTYCFSIATIVTRTRLTVTSYYVACRGIIEATIHERIFQCTKTYNLQ